MESKDIVDGLIKVVENYERKGVKIEGMEELVKIMYESGIQIFNIAQNLQKIERHLYDIKNEVRTVASAGL